jgi:hypothetical protein
MGDSVVARIPAKKKEGPEKTRTNRMAERPAPDSLSVLSR